MRLQTQRSHSSVDIFFRSFDKRLEVASRTILLRESQGLDKRFAGAQVCGDPQNSNSSPHPRQDSLGAGRSLPEGLPVHCKRDTERGTCSSAISSLFRVVLINLLSFRAARESKFMTQCRTEHRICSIITTYSNLCESFSGQLAQ